MSSISLSTEYRSTLLSIAQQSIACGLRESHALAVNVQDYPAPLQAIRASFVTLEIEDRLRGCIGALEARLALVEDVAEHAYAAAFLDPRFPPVTEEEYPQLDIHISVLSPATPMPFASEADLLAQLRPGIDGLILNMDRHRATFLPSVWDSLPQAEQFLAHLKRKAGLTENFWSEDIRVSRYTTESFGQEDIA